MTLKWENANKGLCVVCSNVILNASYATCKSCNQICEVHPKGKRIPDGDYFITDIKSNCCESDVSINFKHTCRGECHSQLIKEMTEQVGEFKKIIDIETKIAYKVPTKDIIEKGIMYGELSSYPRWQ